MNFSLVLLGLITVSFFIVLTTKVNLLWLGLCMTTSIFLVSVFGFLFLDGFVSDIDGTSMLFIGLSTFLIPVCQLVAWYEEPKVKEFLLCLLLTEFCLVAAFSVTNLLLFYIFFESVAVPIFLIIGGYGSRLRRIEAAFRFFLYTLVGSVLMLLSIVVLYSQAGTLSLSVLKNQVFPIEIQLPLFLTFFCAFAIKLPMLPFHVWLPEAHSEAPTAGSVLLAGILLKLGGYGLFRFAIPLFPEAAQLMSTPIFLLSGVAILYTTLATLIQIDFKRMIAYSSVGHMACVTVGLFSFTPVGVEGAIFVMLSHGFISSGLFICGGFLYDRYKTRLMTYYGGVATIMPVFSTIFFFLMLANLGFPGTSSFISELLVFVGGTGVNTVVALTLLIQMVVTTGYTIWLFNRMCYGSLSSNYVYYSDLNIREMVTLLLISLPIVLLGLYPYPFQLLVEPTVMEIVFRCSKFL